ncbi:MAG TPA: tetratricopeptide repeat protein, partial [Verrucomicrobiae bacterium]
KMQGWMESAGFLFEPERFKVEPPPLAPFALMDKVEQKCRAGQFNEAAHLLREILAKDPLNEPAFVQLVRIYTQDLKNRREAQNLIDGAADAFSPKLLDYLNRSLDEWIQAPMRSQPKPNKLFGWLPGKNNSEPPQKISLVAPPIVRPASPVKMQDPMEQYLNRVKKTQRQPPPPRFVLDPVEKLLVERRLGTAAEKVKQKAEAAPEDFGLWLRYAEVLGHHCGDVQAAQKVIERMERSGLFKKSQMKKAHTQLKKWRKHHTNPYNW